MSNQYLAPTQKRQNWTAIWISFGFFFTLAFTGLLWLSWNWVTDWGSLQAHWPFSKPKSLLMFSDWKVEWLDYWRGYIIKYDLLWHFVLHTTIHALISIYVAYRVAKLIYVPGGYDLLRHMEGLSRFEYAQAIKHSKRMLKTECNSNNCEQGISLHPELIIPKIRESQNVFIGGGQGSGKTIVSRQLARQTVERSSKSFIYDEKKEFTSWFYDPSSVVLIAPWDVRGIKWDISEDAKTPAAAQLISEGMIEENSRDPLWSNGARMIFTGMMVVLFQTRDEWGWAELADMLSLPESELLPLLEKHYPRASRFVVENSKTTQSFYATLLGYLGFIYTLKQAWPKSYEKGFSITKWTLSDRTRYRTVIIQADKRYKDIGAPVCNAMIGLMTATILARSNSRTRELWLFLDELGNLPASDSLIEWLSLGRTKGCRCVAGTQSISQLRKIYGEDGTDSLMALFGNFVALRNSSAGSSAKYCAEVFGQRLVERPSSNTDINGRTTVNWHPESLPLVTESDICHQLPQPSKKGVHGFLLIPGWAVYKLCWPLSILPEIAREHIPAKWLSVVPKTQVTNTSDSKRRGRRN